jgi:hypothetical protein
MIMATLLPRVLLATMLVLGWCGAAWAADTAGTVVAISGPCFVEADGKRTPLKMGDPVHVTDTVDVMANAKLKLRMSDGSIVSAVGGSQMTIGDYAVDADGKRHAAQLSLVQGLLRAVVAPVDRSSTFEVKTAAGTAGVRSTDWFIEAEPGITTVAVQSGSVALTSGRTGAAVVIPAGSGASVSVGEDPTPPRVLRKAEFSALSARTDIAAAPAPAPSRRPQQPRQPAAPEYVPPADPAPQPPAPSYNPDQYSPGPYNPGPGAPPRGGGYNPNPGGYPGGGYNPQPGGGETYEPGGGYGRNPGGNDAPAGAGRRY